jgi:hypothetical protein
VLEDALFAAEDAKDNAVRERRREENEKHALKAENGELQREVRKLKGWLEGNQQEVITNPIFLTVLILFVRIGTSEEGKS